tara:strand:+ start:528 stop:920 length:393 start_codon:yes stop_codon:yes gene_type:complete
MSNTPEELKYTQSHEWIREEEDGTIVVGITDHAQEALGDLVFIELPEIGTIFNMGEDAAVVESVKAASDVYSPISGEVTESNEALVQSPETINKNPYEDGWMFKLKPTDTNDFGSLLEAEAYINFCENEN